MAARMEGRHTGFSFPTAKLTTANGNSNTPLRLLGMLSVANWYSKQSTFCVVALNCPFLKSAPKFKASKLFCPTFPPNKTGYLRYCATTSTLASVIVNGALRLYQFAGIFSWLLKVYPPLPSLWAPKNDEMVGRSGFPAGPSEGKSS